MSTTKRGPCRSDLALLGGGVLLALRSARHPTARANWRRMGAMSAQRHDVVVIGGGQAGLAIGCFLARQGRRFTILDAAATSYTSAA
ncbi:hypothetical protein DSM104329_02063 [Capillimicrobium parvum]|uniref:FAD-dependent oxidoreductase n=1 Tax=Capillimicrobium parvum TaxID=2884022 RepID=A0A9E7C0R5_9ACTN|nr:hypothetical protein DSM104329_02063 [Capillimicrobium parvum]